MLGYYGSYDVVVCGGGTSGVSAAIASARAGAKTLLIERVGQLGGQMNFSGPPGFSYAFFYNGRHERIVGGIPYETYERLLKDGHAQETKIQKWRDNYQFSYVDPDWWGFLIYDMMQEEGVELMLHTMVTDVIADEGKTVKGVVTDGPSGAMMVMGKVVIDCTGEGDVAWRAGAETEKLPADELEPATTAFTADGVDWDKFFDYVHNNIDEFIFGHLRRGYNTMTDEEIKAEVKKCNSMAEVGEIMGFLSLKQHAIETGEWHNQSGVGLFMMPREGGVIQAHFQHSSQVGYVDCSTVEGITKAEVEGRKQDVIAWKFFKKYVPGFEKAYITRVCPETRIRETRRVMGDYVLTEQDVENCARFPDTIGRSSFPAGSKHVLPENAIENNGTLTAPSVSRHPKDGGSNDIPYRVMVIRGFENFMVAGKAVSATRPAHQRFLQQTMVTGQAAGVAAALCAKKGITPRQMESEANMKELQDALRGQNVILEGPA